MQILTFKIHRMRIVAFNL